MNPYLSKLQTPGLPNFTPPPNHTYSFPLPPLTYLRPPPLIHLRPNLIHLNININPRKSLEQGFLTKKDEKNREKTEIKMEIVKPKSFLISQFLSPESVQYLIHLIITINPRRSFERGLFNNKDRKNRKNKKKIGNIKSFFISH